MAGPLQEALDARKFLILDGAMGTELQRRGVDIGLPLWSANALMSHPETVLLIHQEYIRAGADIITTNTFRTTGRVFRNAHLFDQSARLTLLAVNLALQAREASPAVLVAGSIAPLEDCYRPDLVPREDEMLFEYREQASRLAAAGVDFILLETMHTIREAYAACVAATATGKEVVVSFVCNKDGALLGGESLQDAVKALEGLHPAAFSINCVSPRFIGAALEKLRSTTQLPLMLYGNTGNPEADRSGTMMTADVTVEEYAAHAVEWQQQGVSIIGGCCGTTPEYVKALTMACKTNRRAERETRLA